MYCIKPQVVFQYQHQHNIKIVKIEDPLSDVKARASVDSVDLWATSTAVLARPYYTSYQ